MSQVETVRQVFLANQRFYEAFESLDIRRMAAVWQQDEGVQCIHPGWSRLTGWRAVRDSWIRIFNHTRSMTFQITDTQVTVEGAVAWVVCIERITVLVDDEPQETQVLATNVFVRPEHHDDPSEERRWLMVHHHGSPVFQRPEESEDPADQ
ncbi:MAG: nuclear transport factor 2 family protein [Nitrospirae bacterium]|nr:nuclear transport factor 2 family protein [Nitrospirota bacterium]